MAISRLSLVLLCGLSLTWSARAHDTQNALTSDQQNCVNSLNKSFGKVDKAINKVICACIKDFAKGKSGVTDVPACVQQDRKGEIANAKQKTVESEANKCEGLDKGGASRKPDLFATDAVTINQAAMDKAAALLSILFGSDVNATLISEADDKDASKCQQSIARDIKKCQETKLKEFEKCKKNALKIGREPWPDGADSEQELEVCIFNDPKQKIAKKCDLLGEKPDKIRKDLDKKCVSKDVDLCTAFPHCCPPCSGADIECVHACLETPVECQTCLAINKADGLGADCDLLDDGDPNNQSCGGASSGGCVGQEFDSTMEAIQAIVFDAPVYGCSTGVCHGGTPGQGNLNLSIGNSYANLVGVPSTISPSTDRVEPGDHLVSVLYDKLQAGVHATLPVFGGSAMPFGGTPLTETHLEAVELWIRGGAPEELVVDGTAELLATCLPDPDPLIIPPPDPPGAGVGAQLWQTPWDLLSQSEREICMSTYYDLTATNLVPVGAKIPCALGPGNNPSGECFQWHRQLLVQDPQSHHSIIHLYNGASDTTDPGWGSWTYKFQDPTNPLNGQPCDPTAVDPNTGYNAGCSSSVTTSIACVGYGPADNAVFFSSGFSGSQEPVYDQTFADTVYAPLPMAGIIIWNSHAFNNTLSDSTMSQYLNLDFAGPADQVNEVSQIFDSDDIFIMNIPPFQAFEYCGWYRIPKNSNHFQLSSHTHRHGVRFRIWEPPNDDCNPGSGAGFCQPGDPNQLVYESFEYSDPVQLDIDPPDFYGDIGGKQRRFLYCSLYDNGSTPTSPAVKRNSDPLGGCGVGVRACLDGPNKGNLCGGNDAFCDSSPGAGDGECDACPVLGGVTTEDEMFIMLGLRY